MTVRQEITVTSSRSRMGLPARLLEGIRNREKRYDGISYSEDRNVYPETDWILLAVKYAPVRCTASRANRAKQQREHKERDQESNH
jgi:hypothetical protein